MVTTASDALNTNVVFTVRDVAPTVPLIATANDPVAGDMLKLAGCSHVLHLGDMLGQSLARRILGGDAVTHVIGQFDQLLIAEATAAHTPLVGTTLRQSRLREQVGVSVIGVWDRGHFAMARPETPITPHTVLVLAGSQQQLQQYDAYFCVYNVLKAPVVVIGGGRVGRATGGLWRSVIWTIGSSSSSQSAGPGEIYPGERGGRGDIAPGGSHGRAGCGHYNPRR